MRLPTAASARTPPRGISLDALAGGEVERPRELGGKRIVIVDDEADVRSFLVLLLQDAGAEVVACAGAAEARAALDERVPDLLLSDIGMPEEDGLSFIASVRGRSAEAGGAVRAVSLVSIKAKAYSFQAKIKAKTVVAAIPVAAWGKTILKNAWRRE